MWQEENELCGGQGVGEELHIKHQRHPRRAGEQLLGGQRSLEGLESRKLPPRSPCSSLSVEPTFPFPVAGLVHLHHLPDFILFLFPRVGKNDRWV